MRNTVLSSLGSAPGSGPAVKIIAEAQHTPEWFAARRGRITASEAHKALMGRHTKGRRLYVEKLADDLEDIPDFDDEDVKPWYTDGIYYESWARGWYSFRHDVDVTEVGFIVHDEYDWIGCSPDGLIGDSGGLEIKYRKSLRTFSQHATRGMPPSSYPQMQCSMLVTGRDWWDYCNYWRSDDHDKEKGHVQRVHRDQAYIDNTLLPAFLGLWQDVYAEVETRKLQRQAARG